jgi:LuxR family maltose regulon positive regulatory protein
MDAPGQGLDRIARFLASGHSGPPPLVAVRLRTVEARLRLASGDVTGATQLTGWTDGPAPAEQAALDVQLAVHTGATPAARRILEAWPDDPEPRSMIDRRFWSAVVDDMGGDHERAQRALAEVVDLTEPEGHVRLFLDAGREARRLLRSLPAHATAHLQRILEQDAASPTPASDTIGLSNRELLVLRYLPSRLSNAELAARLFVSPNTVKTHLRSIYRRLGVNGRREAVEEAERLGLI